MILLIAHAMANAAADADQTIKVWVDTQDLHLAEQRARVKLQAEGFMSIRFSDVVTTERDDYFAPCTSLDAFELAVRTGIAILVT